jgi:hypothetical protein
MINLQAIDNLFKGLIIVAFISIPLALWKLVEIVLFLVG